MEKRVRMAFLGVREEVGQYVRAFNTLRETDMLIIPGTGLLTDAYGLSSWGPYNVFKWSLVAKLRGCKVLFVSVGVGPLYGTLGRFLAKSALLLADYRSYRDSSSATYLPTTGFRATDDPVYPDLVFSLPQTLLPPDANRVGGNRVVGLGLMLYAGKYSVATPRDETYRVYLESLVLFVKWLLAHDYDVRLLVGDDDDTPVIEDFQALLRMRLGPYDDDRVSYQPIATVRDILCELAETDVVVATRFHNVLLALLLTKPVIAISFHHKCASLMSSMGLSQYCHDINEMDIDGLITQFKMIEKNRDMVKGTIRRGVEKSRAALNEQYDLLFSRL